MEIQFNAIEIRIIGTLIEKQITTPEYYPLTMNALVNGCNQKSNRYPVLTLSEDEIHKALYNLQLKRFVQKLLLSNSRSERYRHLFDDQFPVSIQEKAILCELFIRGAQTPGELRTHTERMFPIAGLDEVQKTLDALGTRQEGPFVVRLERQPGQKESRYMHLFCGTPEQSFDEQTEPGAEKALPVQESKRLTLLEEKVENLTRELEELKAQVKKLTAHTE